MEINWARLRGACFGFGTSEPCASLVGWVSTSLKHSMRLPSVCRRRREENKESVWGQNGFHVARPPSRPPSISTWGPEALARCRRNTHRTHGLTSRAAEVAEIRPRPQGGCFAACQGHRAEKRRSLVQRGCDRYALDPPNARERISTYEGTPTSPNIDLQNGQSKRAAPCFPTAASRTDLVPSSIGSCRDSSRSFLSLDLPLNAWHLPVWWRLGG